MRLTKKVRDKAYYSAIGKLTAGVPRSFSLRADRNCTPKCRKWDTCIMQEASKVYFNGKCALANQPEEMSVRILKLLSGDPKLLKQNIVELIGITEQLTRETKNPELHLKLIDRLIKYHELIAGEKKQEDKKVSLIDQLRIANMKEEAVDAEQVSTEDLDK